MKKFLKTMLLSALCVTSMTVYAAAAEDTLKVGLYYGNNALSAANLQNEVGTGYALGWFDETSRDFISVGSLQDEKITMTTSDTFHVQIDEEFASFEEAKYVADQFRTGFVCYINNTYRVRVNSFTSLTDAETAAGTYTTYTWNDMFGGTHAFQGKAVSPSATGVTVILGKLVP